MTEVEALKAALAKEKGSIKLYLDFSVAHPNLKGLFYELMSEEEKHVRMIEQKITQVMRY
jgi:rubrerythrin